MTKLSQEQIKLRNHILEAVIERIDACYGKPTSPSKVGNKREEAALNYIIGATKVLELLDNELAQYFESVIVLIFSVRGTYEESCRILADQKVAV